MVLYLDCEWNKRGELLAFQYAIDNNDVVILHDAAAIRVILYQQYTHIVIHNAKSDLYILRSNEIIDDDYLLDLASNTRIFDTMQVFFMLTCGTYEASDDYDASPSRVLSSLRNVARIVLGRVVNKTHQISFLEIDNSNALLELTLIDPTLLDYMIDDVLLIRDLYAKLSEKITDKNKIAYMLDMRVIPVLVITEYNGCKIDVNKWGQLLPKWQTELDTLRKLCDAELVLLDKPPINYNSPVQLKRVLIELGLDIKTTSKDILAKLVVDNKAGECASFIDRLLQFKRMQKLISMYGNKTLERIVNADGYISTYYTQLTVTGRFSSKRDDLRNNTANIQNIPARTQYGKDLMACFVSRYPQGSIVTTDMAQAELRIAASLSGDKTMMSLIEEGDLHAYFATISWQAIHDNDEVISKAYNPKWRTTGFRDEHKQVVFGLLYGAQASRIADVLSVDIFTARKCYDAIKAKAPVVLGYLERNARLAYTNRCLVNSYSGRIKYNLNMTEAYNWEIQSINADAMKHAWYEITAYIHKHNIEAKVINTVHDAIVIDINTQDPEKCEFIKTLMARSLSLFLTGIVGKADITISPCWSK